MVEAAAVALIHGVDPLRYLGLAPRDQALMAAALNRAQHLRAEHEKNLADYVAGKTAGLTARSITRWIARAFR